MAGISFSPRVPVKSFVTDHRLSFHPALFGKYAEVLSLLRRHQDQMQIRLDLFFMREEKVAQDLIELVMQEATTVNQQPDSTLAKAFLVPQEQTLAQQQETNQWTLDTGQVENGHDYDHDLFIPDEQPTLEHPPRQISNDGDAVGNNQKEQRFLRAFHSTGQWHEPPEEKIFSPEFQNTWRPTLDTGRRVSAKPALDERKSKSFDRPPPEDLSGNSWLHYWSKRLVRSPVFDGIFLSVIIINALVMGIEVHFDATGGQENALRVLTVVQTSCSILFMIELVIRLFAERCRFFYSSQWPWNWFDFVLVAFSTVELGLEVLRNITGSELGGAKSLSTARILRILRMTRIGRTIRFVRALRVLLVSILATLKTVVFALLLVMMVIYFYAVILTQVAMSYLSDVTTKDPALTERWGDLIKSILTLFYSITGGLDWNQALEPLNKINALYGIIFVTYVVFMCFCLLNAITGAFCEGALESQMQDKELQLHDLVEGKKGELRQLGHLIEKIFNSLDSDQSGEIDMHEFADNVKNETVQELLSTLDLQPEDAWAFFRLIDKDASGNLDMDEFVSACLQLKGAARSIDLAKIMYDQTLMRKQNRMFMQYVVEQLGKLRSDVKHHLTSHMESQASRREWTF